MVRDTGEGDLVFIVFCFCFCIFFFFTEGLTNIFHKGSGSKYFHLAGILVFHCYPTNYHKFRALKQHPFIVSQFLQV